MTHKTFRGIRSLAKSNFQKYLLLENLCCWKRKLSRWLWPHWNGRFNELVFRIKNLRIWSAHQAHKNLNLQKRFEPSQIECSTCSWHEELLSPCFCAKQRLRDFLVLVLQTGTHKNPQGSVLLQNSVIHCFTANSRHKIYFQPLQLFSCFPDFIRNKNREFPEVWTFSR